ASDTATRPVFEKVIPTSVGSGWGEAVRTISPPPRWRRWRNFNPIWLKYSLQQELLQIYRNRHG
ncbi:hypothetical protein, partial [Mesorhizobium sp.]|uniref:hypothetical protein n=1 Tax=Mesorhizobium sp. TaxID=1871066 RepID=UPI0025BC7ABF